MLAVLLSLLSPANPRTVLPLPPLEWESWLARRDGTDGVVPLLDWYDR